MPLKYVEAFLHTFKLIENLEIEEGKKFARDHIR